MKIRIKILQHSFVSIDLLICCRADNAEASAVAPAVSNVPAPVAHLAAAGVVVPTATTGIVSVTAEGIPAPFTYVTAHIIQAIDVRVFLRNRMWLFSTVTVIPSDRTKIITASVTVTLTSSCSILPFVNCR